MDEIAKGFATLNVYIAQDDIFSLIPAVVVFRHLARSAFQLGNGERGAGKEEWGVSLLLLSMENCRKSPSVIHPSPY